MTSTVLISSPFDICCPIMSGYLAETKLLYRFTCTCNSNEAFDVYTNHVHPICSLVKQFNYSHKLLVDRLVSFTFLQQFVHNHFKEAVVSTSSPHRYSTTVVTNNNRIIEFHISDFPVLSKFPEDSLQEWNLQCSQRNKHTVDVGSSSTSNAAAGTTTGTCIPPQSFCRLRQVSAYVLVFDASRPAVTFQYIRQIREQILRNGGNEAYKRPIVVAVNKQDLVVQHQRPAIVGNSGSRSHRLNGGNQSSNTKNNPAWPTNEWSCLVRKQWRCLYVETSAKFNWQVSTSWASSYFITVIILALARGIRSNLVIQGLSCI